MLQHQGGLYLVLCKIYPSFPWDPLRFAQTRSVGKKMQTTLSQVVSSFLPPGTNVIDNYMHPQVLQFPLPLLSPLFLSSLLLPLALFLLPLSTSHSLPPPLLLLFLPSSSPSSVILTVEPYADAT